MRESEFTGTLMQAVPWLFEQEKKAKEKALSKKKPYEEIEYDISIHKKKRSIQANAYAWALCTKIADKVNNTKDNVYLELLRSYGQSEIIRISANVTEEELSKLFKYYEVMEENAGYRYIKVYYGTSTYDTKEMSVFIDGIISEAKILEIPILSPDEIRSLKEEWKEES